MSKAVLRLAGECPNCGKPLVRRNRRKDNQPFLSCSGYPNCKFAEDWDPHIQELKQLFDRRIAELENLRGTSNENDIKKTIREIMVFAHPDRWPAAWKELAHGVTARLSALRDKK
jgi:ssDNA-binding Zn-finger/Zn-ribbon topoisomerase 1